MIHLEGLERRIEKLEHGDNGPDEEFLKIEAMEHVLDTASPDQTAIWEDVLEELIALRSAGFADAEIAGMMGERWPVVLDLMARAEAELDRLIKQSRASSNREAQKVA